ncbi:hypothetical protein [Parasediminibacterium sp. JCM 36343]|uniref:hypothetical protein n=1 Tax=Parasediminibacterium sp. JCM 36343 TaxID=3374279 RepID=UPI00397C9BB8
MTGITLTIKDETVGGNIINKIDVSFASELTTIKDIIAARVKAEVDLYNQQLPLYFKGLVQPSDAETTLNGYKLKDKRKVDTEKQCYIAFEAFYKNAYFILVDNIQAEALDQMVVINPQTNISFIKLTPLVGG